jgi:hypothetical protein
MWVKGMSYTTEMYNLIIRFTKDSKGKEITLDDLYKLPYWRCVWGSWRAKAYYKMDGYYESLSDVPEGLEDYIIMTDKVNTKYGTFNGRHPYVQLMTKEYCKEVYGSKS